MTIPDQLATVAYDKQPVFYNDPELSWEQRLAYAHEEARKHLAAILPPGATLSTSQYELAADVAGTQIDTFGSAWMPRLQSGQDIDPESALSLPADQMRQYYLGRYAQASANLGAYLTGFARQQVAYGSISQKDFDLGAELRLRSLSDIIYAGRTGSLPALIDGERYAQKKTGAGNSLITIATPGVTVQPAAGLQGLGFAWTPAMVLAVGLVSCLAVGVVAASVVAWRWNEANASNRRSMLEICQDAQARNHPDARTICKDMSEVVAEMGDPSNGMNPAGDMIKNVGTIAGAIGGLYLLFAFAPQISQAITSIKGTMSSGQQQTQIANLARFHRNAVRRGWSR